MWECSLYVGMLSLCRNALFIWECSLYVGMLSLCGNALVMWPAKSSFPMLPLITANVYFCNVHFDGLEVNAYILISMANRNNDTYIGTFYLISPLLGYHVV